MSSLNSYRLKAELQTRFHCFRAARRAMKAPMKMGCKTCIFSVGGVAALHEGLIDFDFEK
jgi:hypothetical protein